MTEIVATVIAVTTLSVHSISVSLSTITSICEIIDNEKRIIDEVHSSVMHSFSQLFAGGSNIDVVL